jgi:hypothetical protein
MKNRNGSYKKVLIDPPLLEAHGDYLRAGVATLESLSFTPFEFTTLYMLLFLRIKHPKNWLQKKPSSESVKPDQKKILELIPDSFLLSAWEKEKLKDITCFDLFDQYNLKGIPLSINRTMMNWAKGLWKIEALKHIPNSRELLNLQVKNTRCMTLIVDPKKIDQLVFGVRDPLSFVLHDLMHADQFFNQNESLKGQLGFYQLLENIYDQPLLKAQLKSDESFRHEFEYVASDMNAYVIHLFKCLKSCVYRTNVSAEFFALIIDWWKMNEREKIASHHLNTPDFSFEDEIVLKDFFERQQEIIP